MKSKKIFDNYLLSILLACFMVALVNFATSTVKLFFGASSTPVYTKVVDSVSTTPDATAKQTITLENQAKAITHSYAATTRVTTATATTIPVSGNYISLGGHSVSLEYKQPAGSTLIVPGNHAAYYRNFIYGHNTASVFGYLNRISVGEAITVSINGETRTYHVVKKERQAIGDISMAKLIYNRSYAHILMTCVGDGSTHRDIIYLN